MGGLSRKAVITWKNFSIPMSYRIAEDRSSKRFSDCLNVFSNQGRLDTRHGMSRLNSSALASQALSVSFFKTISGTVHYIVKAGTTMYSINTSGAATSIKTGLTSTTKHTGVTIRDRHIIAIEEDGLFAYDSAGNFYELGEGAPGAPTVAAAAGGSLPDSTYRVRYSYYASSRGYETNGGTRSDSVATSGANNKISVSAMSTSATDPDIDKKRIYMQDVTNNSDWLFIAEIDLAAATYTITDVSDSQDIAPTRHAVPGNGGATFVTEFDRGIAYTGRNNFETDVYISESDIPEAINDTGSGLHFNPPGQGEPTGIAQGYYSNDQQRPYLVVTFEKSTHVFSKEFGLTTLSNQIGCVSGRTMRTINGDVYFMSHFGWRVISNGKFVVGTLEDQKTSLKDVGVPITLGRGDIDDVFNSSGYFRELNKNDFSNMFSVFYQELDHYMTWISEGSNDNKARSYIYEFETRGFKSFTWPHNTQCAVEAEDGNGNEIILFADDQGYLYTYSIQEDRTDVDSSGSNVNIEAFALIPWLFGDDFDASRNFRNFIVRAIVSTNNITVKAWTNFIQTTLYDYTYSFPDPTSGFELDVSRLDEDAFGDERATVEYSEDLLLSGRSLLIGFYQTAANSNLGLVNAQLHTNKNGNSN